MSAPDISAEAVERLAASYEREFGRREGGVPATLRALRAALDAAEKERDAYRSSEAEVLAENDALRFTLNNARLNDATGYARGVRYGIRKAVDVVLTGKEVPSPKYAGITVIRDFEDMEEAAAAILALLPATDATKETRDA